MSFIEITKYCQIHYGEQVPIIREGYGITKGGPDTLEEIRIYRNNGDPKKGIPCHWHYIGFGLSDINDYIPLRERIARDHPHIVKKDKNKLNIFPPRKPGNPISGFGFELTFRLKCGSIEELQKDPPDQPITMLQGLALYIYKTKNEILVNDNITWIGSLYEKTPSINNFLLTIDPQLNRLETISGLVQFFQVVGIHNDELRAAREWNPPGVLGMMSNDAETGGPYFVTNMPRRSLFEIEPSYVSRLQQDIDREGSDLSAMNAYHRAEFARPSWFNQAEDAQNDTFDCMPETEQPNRTPSRMSTCTNRSNLDNLDKCKTEYWQCMYIQIDVETAKLLPVMLNGRLAHKRSFSIKGFCGESVIIFVTEGCPLLKTLVDVDIGEHPKARFATKSVLKYVYISDKLRVKMFEDTKNDFPRNIYAIDKEMKIPKLPKNYSWPDHGLHITVVNEETFDD